MEKRFFDELPRTRQEMESLLDRIERRIMNVKTNTPQYDAGYEAICVVRNFFNEREKK